MTTQQITILGVGNILFKDEGVGIRVIERLREAYTFPEQVSLVDGGTLGLGLMGVISEADHLIVVDALKNGDPPGSLYRFDGEDVPKRILAKNSLHQVDLLETLTSCRLVDACPQTVILGVEPEDIDSMDIELSPSVESKVPSLMDMVLEELDLFEIAYKKKTLFAESG